MASSIPASAEIRYYDRSHLPSVLRRRGDGERAEEYVRQMDPGSVEWWMSRYRQLCACILSQSSGQTRRREEARQLRDDLEVGFDVKLKVDHTMLWFWFMTTTTPARCGSGMSIVGESNH